MIVQFLDKVGVTPGRAKLHESERNKFSDDIPVAFDILTFRVCLFFLLRVLLLLTQRLLCSVVVPHKQKLPHPEHLNIKRYGYRSRIAFFGCFFLSESIQRIFVMAGLGFAIVLSSPAVSQQEDCDRYFSARGTGSGYSEKSPASLNSLNDMIQSEGGGSVMCLLPGVYRTGLSVNQGGSSGEPVTIRGEGGYPIFASDFDASTRERKGDIAIYVRASHLTFDALKFRNVGVCFRFDRDVNSIDLTNFYARNVATCVDVARYRDHVVESLTISGAMILQFTRSAILIGSKATDVVIEDSYLDMQPDKIGGQGSDYVTGIALYDAASHIVINNTAVLNVAGKTEGYSQGDGIDAESNVSYVLVLDSYFRNNQDGCIDAKAAHFFIENTVAIGCKRNFRLWQGNFPNGPRCDHCISYDPQGDSHFNVNHNNSEANIVEVYSRDKARLVTTANDGSLSIRKLIGFYPSSLSLGSALSVKTARLCPTASYDVPDIPNPTTFSIENET